MVVEFFIFLYFLYVASKVLISLLQYNFVINKNTNLPKILDDENFIVAKSYALAKEKLSIVSSFVDLAIFIFWIYFGLKFLDAIVQIDNNFIKAVVMVDLFIVVNWIFSLPLELYQTFWLDKKYNFSNIDLKTFAQDTVKSAFLFFIFGSALIFALAYVVSTFEFWWIYGAGLMIITIVLANILYPIIRDKMFDKFEPLKDVELNQKIESLLSSVGFESSGIFSVDASKRDNRLNAYFGGLGKTKRVVLFDTLIQKLSHNELLAVLGHELGHFKNKDMIKNIISMGVLMAVLFGLFGNIPHSVFEAISLKYEASSVLIFILIFSTPILFFVMPLMWYFSRKNEFDADEFGSNLQSKEDLKSALLKLANENKSFPFSHKLQVFFYYSHPPLTQRLEKL